MAYTITLVGCKGDEIEVIAMVMELCSLGMGDASKLVDSMPSVLFENISEESANKYKKLLEGAGAILKIDETAQASASSAPDPFAFPEPDFGKVLHNEESVANVSSVQVEQPQQHVESVAPVVDHVQYPEPEPKVDHVQYLEPEPKTDHVQYVQQVQEVQEVEEQPQRQSVVEITPRNTEPVQEVNPVEEERPVQTSTQTVNTGYTNQTQQAPAQEEEESKEEEPKYDYYGYCPRCGSSFVTVKKVGGLFGSNKIKCVCEACKHKF